MNKSLLCLILILWSSSLMAGWLDRKAEGWAWYEDKEKTEIEKENKPEKIPSQVAVTEPSILEELSQVRKHYEEKLAEAVLYPTEENVAAFMLEQKKWMDQSAKFSKTWSRVLLQQPELDETVTGFPVSQYGIQLQKQIQQEQKESLIKELAQDHGLFFFYEGKSKVSLVFSYLVKELAKKYGWQVFAISVDGAMIEGFVNNKLDNGIAKNFKVSIYPSLFVVNPQTYEVVPISFGLSSIDQIENNLFMQFSNLEEL